MASVHGPKLIAGNSNLKLARSVARRMSLHRGMNVDLVDARVERFNDGEIFVEALIDALVAVLAVDSSERLPTETVRHRRSGLRAGRGSQRIRRVVADESRGRRSEDDGGALRAVARGVLPLFEERRRLAEHVLVVLVVVHAQSFAVPRVDSLLVDVEDRHVKMLENHCLVGQRVHE